MSRVPAVLLLLLLAGCGDRTPEGPAEVRVTAGAQDVRVAPSQYCLDGEPQRYAGSPPVVEVSPGTPIRLTVPDAVAEQGWGVQVFDDRLEEVIGEVDVPAGTVLFDEINSDDVVPPAFYLVVVEDKGGECDAFSGAWPVGFLRAGG